MLIKHSSRILWGSLLLGLCFDLLFWKKPVGITFFLFVLLIIVAGFILARLENLKPARETWLLAGMALFFSAMTFIRQEPFTTFINGLITFACLILLALTFSSGLWLKYSLADAVTGFFRLTGSALGGGSSLLAAPRKADDVEVVDGQPLKHKSVSIWAVIRGLLISISRGVFSRATPCQCRSGFFKRIGETAGY